MELLSQSGVYFDESALFPHLYNDVTVLRNPLSSSSACIHCADSNFVLPGPSVNLGLSQSPFPTQQKEDLTALLSAVKIHLELKG